MAGRINPVSTPQFDGRDPRALQTWGTQVRDAINAALVILNAVFSGDPTNPVAELAGLTLTGALTGTSAAFTSLTVTGTATVGTIAATTGYRSWVGLAHSFQAVGAGVFTIMGLDGTSARPWYYQSPFASSLVSVQISVYGSTTAGNLTIRIVEVNSATVMWTAPGALGPGGSAAYSGANIGTVNFTAGQRYRLEISGSGAGNANCEANIMVST